MPRYLGWRRNDAALQETFAIAGGAFVSRLAAAQTTPSKITAGEVVDRIKAHVGIPWQTKTVDRIVAGDENTPVNGIASVMMATEEVVERTAAEGKNMIVSHETPFYLQQDNYSDILDNAVLRYKLAFLRKHNMAVFRFHDHWHRRYPDGIAAGMVRQLGWGMHQNDPSDPKRLNFSGVTLAQLAKQMQDRLHDRTMRIVGDPDLPVNQVQTSWGYVGRVGGIAILSNPDVNVLIAGETREWELVEYARDCMAIGQKKGLILVGHVLSEQGGMIQCADWLRSFIHEVPVAYVATPQPFWSPDHPVKG